MHWISTRTIWIAISSWPQVCHLSWVFLHGRSLSSIVHFWGFFNLDLCSLDCYSHQSLSQALKMLRILQIHYLSDQLPSSFFWKTSSYEPLFLSVLPTLRFFPQFMHANLHHFQSSLTTLQSCIHVWPLLSSFSQQLETLRSFCYHRLAFSSPVLDLLVQEAWNFIGTIIRTSHQSFQTCYWSWIYSFS